MYTCPMHPEVRQESPGKCPICHMTLVKEGETSQMNSHQEEGSYTPLIVIVTLISLVTAALGIRDYFGGDFNWGEVMMNFMAGFFLVFAGFKLVDIKGFAEGYSTYDLLAQRVYNYGYIYPFLELGLGILYLLRIVTVEVLLATFVLMMISGIGVAIKLAKKERFQCACLGTFLKVPLTKVTLIEDFGMALMALGMIIL